MAEDIDPTTKIRKDCWDKALYSFGTAYIFNKKAARFSKRLNLLKVFGIVVPALVGATATGYGMDSAFLKNLINVAIPVSIVQFGFSVLAVIFKWEDELAYAYESSKDHNFLSQQFKVLGNIPAQDETALKTEYEKIMIRLQLREEQDGKHDIKELENRMGMRAGLRQFSRECVGCHIIPLSMEPGECSICGKF